LDECDFQHFYRISLAASASLLSSVIAFIGVACYSLLSAKTGRCQGFENTYEMEAGSGFEKMR